MVPQTLSCLVCVEDQSPVAFDAKMTSYQRRCDSSRRIDVNTTSFLRHVPVWEGGVLAYIRLYRQTGSKIEPGYGYVFEEEFRFSQREKRFTCAGLIDK